MQQAVTTESSYYVKSRQQRLDRIRSFTIKNAQGRLQKLDPLRPAQERLYWLLYYLKYVWGLPGRVALLKDRKRGFTTFIAMQALCEVLDFGLDAVFIAQDKKTASHILGMARRAISHMKDDAPVLAKSSDNEIKLADREGLIEVHTAGTKDSTRSRSPQFIELSEAAHASGEVAEAVLNSIDDSVDTTVIQETTANSFDPLFYPTWEAAYQNCDLSFEHRPDGSWEPKYRIKNMKDWNGYMPFFVGIFDDLAEPNPKCWRNFRNGRERKMFAVTVDTYERELMDTRNVPLEFVFWRRMIIKQKCKNSVELFNQEHPESPEMAFISSGRPRFSRTALRQMIVEEPEVGCLYRDDSWKCSIKFRRDEGEMLHRYRKPIPSHMYVIGVDIAKGEIREGCQLPDQSVILVLDKHTREEVAVWFGRVPEESVVEPLELLGRYYNGAYLVIENNLTHVAIEMQKSGRYPINRLYHGMDWEQKSPKARGLVGYHTKESSRNRLIGKLAAWIDDGDLRLHDKNTVSECLNFVWKNNARIEAAAGHNDDHVLALGMAVMGIERLDFLGDYLKPADDSAMTIDVSPIDRIGSSHYLSGRSRKTGY